MFRERSLKVLLAVTGLLFLLGLFAIVQVVLQPPNPESAFEQMLGSVYGVLGIYLLLAVRKPSAHRSLIAFTAWSSVLHATVMAVQAMRGAIPRIDLLRAVLPMFVIGVALIVLGPVKQPEASVATVR